MIDLASPRVVGWAFADHMRTDLVTDALRMACTQRRPAAGVIFHSGRGCQYTSGDYAALAADLGVRLSVGRKGECWDNAVSESWFATIKTELIDTRPWPTRPGLRRAAFDYIEGWYNTRRLHSALGYRSPATTKPPSARRPPPPRHDQHTNCPANRVNSTKYVPNSRMLEGSACRTRGDCLSGAGSTPGPAC